ncbi:putative hydro-lyase KRH_21160 [Oryx dammah]|uniref:putative hydro-lyase KRH_21160 n=1 Tax=Oryx dammah TaxID=59534 RepID=UPI001A9A98F3|nr:putative hydro-lyase KRH_21160 [Oryx dammah]
MACCPHKVKLKTERATPPLKAPYRKERNTENIGRVRRRGERLHTAGGRTRARGACPPRRRSRRRARARSEESPADGPAEAAGAAGRGAYLTVTTEERPRAAAPAPAAQRGLSFPLRPQQQQNQLLQPVAISRLPTCGTARPGTRMERGRPAQARCRRAAPPAATPRAGRGGARAARRRSPQDRPEREGPRRPERRLSPRKARGSPCGREKPRSPGRCRTRTAAPRGRVQPKGRIRRGRARRPACGGEQGRPLESPRSAEEERREAAWRRAASRRRASEERRGGAGREAGKGSETRQEAT